MGLSSSSSSDTQSNRLGNSGLTKTSPGLVNLVDTPEWVEANQWNVEGYRLTHEGDLETGLNLLSKSSRFGLPWALSTYTWQCLIAGYFDRGIREFLMSIDECETVVAKLQGEREIASIAKEQLANARSNAALLMLAMGAPLPQARDIWIDGAEVGHPESMFYLAVVAEKMGEAAKADAMVRRLPLSVWHDVRQTLAEGITETGWLGQWSQYALPILERNPPAINPPNPSEIDLDAVIQLPRAAAMETREGLSEAVQGAMEGSIEGETALRNIAEGGDASSWIARLELGALLTDSNLRPSTEAQEGIRFLSACLHAPYRDIVAAAAWNLYVAMGEQHSEPESFMELALSLGDGTALRNVAEHFIQEDDLPTAIKFLERATHELAPGDQNRALARARLAVLHSFEIEEPFRSWFVENQASLTTNEWLELTTQSLYAGLLNVDVAQAAIATRYFEDCAANCFFEIISHECGDCGRTPRSFIHAASGEGDGDYAVFELLGKTETATIEHVGLFIPFMNEDRESLKPSAPSGQFLDIITSCAPLVLGTLVSDGQLVAFDAAKSLDDHDVSVRVDVPPDEYVIACWLRPEAGIPALSGGIIRQTPLTSVAMAAVRGPLASSLLAATNSTNTEQRDALTRLLWDAENRTVASLMFNNRPHILRRIIDQGELVDPADSFLLQLAEQDTDSTDACTTIQQSGRAATQETLALLELRGYLEPKLPWWQPQMSGISSDIWSPILSVREGRIPALAELPHSSVWLKRCLASQTNLTSEQMHALAIDSDARVRKNLASNNTLSPELLQQLASDTDAAVVSAVAANHQTPQRTLVELATRTHPPSNALVSNPHFPNTLIAGLLATATTATRSLIASRPDLTQEIASRLTSDLQSVRSSLAANPACPPAILAILAEDENGWVRKQVAENPTTPDSVLAILSLDSEDSVRSSVLSNPSSSEGSRAQASLLGSKSALPDSAKESASSLSPHSAQTKVGANLKLCVKCGTSVTASQRFCGNCGAEIAIEAALSTSNDEWRFLQSEWRLRGNFNVEGGAACYSTQIFDVCDCENTSTTACTYCGRSAGKYVAVTAGAGDGVYPVFQLVNENGDVTGAIAVFEQSWAIGMENDTNAPSNIASVAKPISAGLVSVTERVYVSDASSGWNSRDALVDVDLPPGTYEAIAWQADMDILRERGMEPFRRQIALALYSVDLIQALEGVSIPDRRPQAQTEMSSASRMFDQVLAHQTPRWADACMYNFQEDYDRGEVDRAESWLLQAAIHGHSAAVESISPDLLSPVEPLDIARKLRLLGMRGQQPKDQ